VVKSTALGTHRIRRRDEERNNLFRQTGQDNQRNYFISNLLFPLWQKTDYILIKEIPGLDCFYVHRTFLEDYTDNLFNFYKKTPINPLAVTLYSARHLFLEQTACAAAWIKARSQSHLRKKWQV
jgi:hypothetical protein